MYKIRTVLAVLLIGVLAFSSCKKSSSTPTSSTGISFKFDGASKSTATVVADYIKSENTLQISGSLSAASGVSLAIQNPKVGTFDVASGDAVAAYIAAATNNNSTYIGTTGSVTITEFSGTAVSGTFQFTGATQSGLTGTITEGKFQAKLITQ